MIAVPQPAIVVVKRWEGLARIVRRAHPVQVVPYLCPANYWTIGYGHLCRPDHPAIGEPEAEAYLAQDLRVALVDTIRYCPTLIGEPETRLAAIVSFTFNLGATRLKSSTLRWRLLERKWEAAARELRRWIYAGGRVLPGLVARREAEAQLLQLGRH